MIRISVDVSLKLSMNLLPVAPTVPTQPQPRSSEATPWAGAGNGCRTYAGGAGSRPNKDAVELPSRSSGSPSPVVSSAKKPLGKKP